MKVLFVSSGNSLFGISPIVFNQGESLKELGIALDYFTIKGRGVVGYIRNIYPLKKYIKIGGYDIIHVHYSLSSLLVTLAFSSVPVVVSLMGSDTKMGIFWRILIKINYFYFWDKIIVKSKSMKNKLSLEKAIIIPNGVDINKFKVIEKKVAKNRVNFTQNKKHFLFLANPKRFEKNFALARDAVNLLPDSLIEMHCIYNKNPDDIVYYLNATDLLILTSLWEGSPNVIKEAMACNCPIVSTQVGDVRSILGRTNGCYLTTYDPEDVADKLMIAIKFSERFGKTNGRIRIKELGLSSDNIARKIIDVYREIGNNKCG